jgi:hypothetical protein
MNRPITTFFGRWIARSLITAGVVATERHFGRARKTFPEHVLGNVRIYGNQPFVDSAVKALSQLNQLYPYGYSLVQRYVRGIVEGDSQRGKGIFLGVIYRQWRRKHELPLPPNRVAAQLVRQAIKMRKVSGFSIWRSPRSELGNLYRELKAMTLLGCDPKYFHDLQNQITKYQKRLKAQRMRMG